MCSSDLRTLGSSGGKHCKSLEENVWGNVVSTPKNMVRGEINAFSPLFYRKWTLAMLIHGKCKFLCE